MCGPADRAQSALIPLIYADLLAVIRIDQPNPVFETREDLHLPYLSRASTACSQRARRGQPLLRVVR